MGLCMSLIDGTKILTENVMTFIKGKLFRASTEAII